MNLRFLYPKQLITCPVNHISRSVSTLSAIRRGVRSTVKGDSPAGSHLGAQKIRAPRLASAARTREGDLRLRNDTRGNLRTRVSQAQEKYSREATDTLKPARRSFNYDEEEKPERAPRPRKLPELNIEYTTPASEFIYGTSAVLAALKTGHRRGYKLYIVEDEDQGSRGLQSLRKFALLRGIEVIAVKTHQQPTLDRLSQGRPHNVRFRTVTTHLPSLIARRA